MLMTLNVVKLSCILQLMLQGEMIEKCSEITVDVMLNDLI